MSTLIRFIEELATNPDLLRRYSASPETTMKAFGLQPQEISVLLSGDKAKLEQLIGKAGPIITFMFPAR